MLPEPRYAARVLVYVILLWVVIIAALVGFGRLEPVLTEENVVLALAVLVGLYFFFLPAIIVSGKPQATPVTVLNVLAVPIPILWVGALVWALWGDRGETTRCPFCAERIAAVAVVCPHCRSELASPVVGSGAA